MEQEDEWDDPGFSTLNGGSHHTLHDVEVGINKERSPENGGDVCVTQGLGKRKRSPVWKHYSVEADCQGKLIGTCKYCKVAKYNASPRSGTSNFFRHLQGCAEYKKLNLDGDSNVRVAGVGKVDQQMYRRLVAEAILRNGYCFSWVDHEANRKLHNFLNGNVHSVSRNTIKKVCLQLHHELKGKIKNVFRSLPGKICLTSDLWTACTQRGYLCVTAHYIDENWKLMSKLLCFRHCPPPHGGFELSVMVTNVLSDWGIEKKIFSVTLDNASNNSTMMSNLKQGVLKDTSCENDPSHIRCGAHILNLVVKDGLDGIDHCVSKVREGIKYIDGSERRIIKLEECAKKLDMSLSIGLWLDVATRWNSTYIMLDRALKYKNVLNYYFAGVEGGSKYALSSIEWAKVEKICSLLEPFYEITKFFSGSDYPTASLYFPQVWKIHMRLQNAVLCGDPDIGPIAARMLEKFKKYWEDYVVVLSFGVIFDPRYKWEFVRFALVKVHGETEGGRQADEIRSQFDKLYKEYGKYAGVPSKMADDSQVQLDGIEEFASSSQQDETETDSYLKEKLVSIKVKLDILDYWKENASRLPVLASMARDILAIPISTVASKSAFSMGGRILNKWRSSLLPRNVEVLVTTKDWLSGYDDFTEEGVSLKRSNDFTSDNEEM